jgi:hypothetical protein
MTFYQTFMALFASLNVTPHADMSTEDAKTPELVDGEYQLSLSGLTEAEVKFYSCTVI